MRINTNVNKMQRFCINCKKQIKDVSEIIFGEEDNNSKSIVLCKRCMTILNSLIVPKYESAIDKYNKR